MGIGGGTLALQLENSAASTTAFLQPAFGAASIRGRDTKWLDESVSSFPRGMISSNYTKFLNNLRTDVKYRPSP
jgi:hypothetical protein